MANQRRSVWEIRFQALKQTLSWKMEEIKLKAGNRALGDGLLSDEKLKLNHEYGVLQKIREEAARLEDLPASRIWIQRDF